MAESLLQEVAQQIEKAVEFDRNQKYDAAIYFYTEAASDILEGIRTNKLGEALRGKAEGYIDRAELLKRLQSEENLKGTSKTQQQLSLERVEFLLYQALNEDEDGNTTEAIELYSQAVELCLQQRTAEKDDSAFVKKLTGLATQALDRAEHLKKQVAKQPTLSPTHQQKRPSGVDYLYQADAEPPQPPSVSSNLGGTAPVTPNTKRKLVSQGQSGYTAEELEVLRSTSVINGREYVPFMSVDLKERFGYPVSFCDKHGKLALAPKQTKRFAKWIRPEEFIDNPCVYSDINSTSIKQTVVSDCSFIASLAIAACYEKRFRKKLVSNIIYPQSKQGEPMFNPCGKYMIRLYINGIARKVIIDDFLPMGHSGELLCSFSNNRTELWVSLLEKAYMKVMGGYNFPGSNSNIDLHALTGWIPERVALRPDQPDFNKEATFEKLLTRYHAGDCLVTLATGQISQLDADRAGLVECHAYAMLDVRKVQGKQLLLLKNPWNHLSWKGRYSAKDMGRWTPDLKRALNYDPQSAQQFDCGEFWIDYDSVCHFFDVIYINWNLSLFSFSYAIHASWNAGVGPSKDLYNIGDNPQYCLEVNNTTPGDAAVWILLTRHITDKDDFANNKEYITVLVYRNEGKTVYYPFDPPPYIDGTRINSPHYLCKMVIKNGGQSRFTLVIAQYEKSTTIRYTLRIFSTVDAKLATIEPFKYKKKAVGEWKGANAGGCANYPDTFKNNPRYQLTLDGPSDANRLVIDLRGPKQYSVGFDMVQLSSKNNQTYGKQTTQAFRPGFCVLELDQVPSGTYQITPQTFRPAQEGPYFLTVQATCPLSLSGSGS